MNDEKKKGGNNRSYLVAKRYNERGCIAIEVKPSRELAQMISKLGWKYLDEGIEIFTVSDPTVYGEYGPYHYFLIWINFWNKLRNYNKLKESF